jgi:hypothetical protein
MYRHYCEAHAFGVFLPRALRPVRKKPKLKPNGKMDWAHAKRKYKAKKAAEAAAVKAEKKRRRRQKRETEETAEERYIFPQRGFCVFFAQFTLSLLFPNPAKVKTQVAKFSPLPFSPIKKSAQQQQQQEAKLCVSRFTILLVSESFRTAVIVGFTDVLTLIAPS